MREFPTTQYEKLKITIEGGSNATHLVTLIRPSTVPAPDYAAPYNRYMVWNNQPLSSLKDLMFKIEPIGAIPSLSTISINAEPASVTVGSSVTISGTIAPIRPNVDVTIYQRPTGGTTWTTLATVKTDSQGRYTYTWTTTETGTYDVKSSWAGDENTLPAQSEIKTVSISAASITGTLQITTTPVAGEIFVNGTSWGLAPQSRVVKVGTYIVSFGNFVDFSTPANQVATVKENLRTTIEGVYQPVPGVTVAQVTNPQLVNATHPMNCDAIENAGTSLSISQISDPVTIIIKNMTIPADVAPPSGTWKVLGDCCVQIIVNNTDITVNATIRIYYTFEQLEASGLDESTLKIHYWNTTLNQWIPIESHVNTDEHYVWASIGHFSLWVIMGQSAAPATPLWLLVTGVVLMIAVVTGVAVYIRRRKP
jgi:hypothetical protein